MDPTAPASQRLMDLMLDPLHLLLIMAPIVILLAVRKKWPAAFQGKAEAWAVFYPLPLTLGGAFAGLTSLNGWVAKLAVGIVAWGLASVLFKVAQPFLKKFMKKTFGVDAEGGILG